MKSAFSSLRFEMAFTFPKLIPPLPRAFYTIRRPLQTALTNTVRLLIEDRENNQTGINASIGKSVLENAIDNGIGIESACEGTMCCTSCHVIMNENEFAQVNGPSEEEKDLLELAYGYCETSRLACQIEVTEHMNGFKFKIPSVTE
ncbi:hypothetical protein ACOME3_002308 [Neoechinorhynchus agilis]